VFVELNLYANGRTCMMTVRRGVNPLDHCLRPDLTSHDLGGVVSTS
jgi:hypothetical protein